MVLSDGEREFKADTNGFSAGGGASLRVVAEAAAKAEDALRAEALRWRQRSDALDADLARLRGELETESAGHARTRQAAAEAQARLEDELAVSRREGAEAADEREPGPAAPADRRESVTAIDFWRMERHEPH